MTYYKLLKFSQDNFEYFIKNDNLNYNNIFLNIYNYYFEN